MNIKPRALTRLDVFQTYFYRTRFQGLCVLASLRETLSLSSKFLIAFSCGGRFIPRSSLQALQRRESR